VSFWRTRWVFWVVGFWARFPEPAVERYAPWATLLQLLPLNLGGARYVLYALSMRILAQLNFPDPPSMSLFGVQRNLGTTLISLFA